MPVAAGRGDGSGGRDARPASGRAITRIFHLAEADNWPSIEKRGLMSAAALLDLPGVTAEDKDRVRAHRAVRTVLGNGAVVRDQTPMPPAALQCCLHGMTPRQWYALLNTKVFFWVDPERLHRHLHACRRSAQVVMVMDATALLRTYAPQASVTPFNTGNARRKPAFRGRATFVPYAAWVRSGWQQETTALGTRPRPRNHRPAELTVDHAVPDAMRFVIDVRRVNPGQAITL